MRLRLIIVLALWALNITVRGKAILNGIIHENEASGALMANVPVSAEGANPTKSDSFGQFNLTFPNKNAGDPAQVLLNKVGYVVVNDVQLEVSLPADPDAKKLIIILSLPELREENAALFYRLKSFEAIEVTYNKKLKALEEAQQADATALANLQKERDQARAAAEKAAGELAKNQPGQSSELYQQAKRLFLDEKIDEAINLLDDEKLRRSVAQAK